MSNAQRLMYSKANQAFVFVFGDQLLRIGDNQMFYRNKADAVRAALKAGLVVDGKGFVTAVDGGEPLNGAKGEGVTEQFEGMNRPEHTPEGYTHFVVVTTPRGKKIMAGNSYASDAKEAVENLPPALQATARVLTRTGAKREGLNPDDDANWGTGTARDLEGLNWALVKAEGIMDDRVLSTHNTKEAAQKAMIKRGGTPDSMFQNGMRIVDVGPGGSSEMIEVMGKRTIRPRSRSRSDGLSEHAPDPAMQAAMSDLIALVSKGEKFSTSMRTVEIEHHLSGARLRELRHRYDETAHRFGLPMPDGTLPRGLGEVSARSRQGTRVRFNPSPGSLVLYTHHPEPGEEGSVTTMPGFGKRTYLPGPGGGLLYVKWDQAGTIGVSPKDVDKVSGSKSIKGFGEWEGEFKRLPYGDMPTEEEFVERTEGHYPYPMELVGEGKNAVLDLGINLNKGGIEEFESKYSDKLGIRVLNAEAMYRFLTKLKDKHDSGEGEEEDEAGNLASSILYTLGYEWV